MDGASGRGEGRARITGRKLEQLAVGRGLEVRADRGRARAIDRKACVVAIADRPVDVEVRITGYGPTPLLFGGAVEHPTEVRAVGICRPSERFEEARVEAQERPTFAVLELGVDRPRDLPEH